MVTYFGYRIQFQYFGFMAGRQVKAPLVNHNISFDKREGVGRRGGGREGGGWRGGRGRERGSGERERREWGEGEEGVGRERGSGEREGEIQIRGNKFPQSANKRTHS
jgi:hypothetical protein